MTRSSSCFFIPVNVNSSSSFAIYRIGKLRRYLDKSSVERLVHAFVSSRLDSCNAVLYGLQDNEIAKLQRVQNTVAHLVTKCKKDEHMKPGLRVLHWLPVQQRIVYKIALLTYKALHGLAPRYISDLIEEYKADSPIGFTSSSLYTPTKEV